MRKYSESEVLAILRMSAEDSLTASAKSQGLTLDEIVALAQEVGLDPEVVRAKAKHFKPQRKRGVIERIVNGDFVTERESVIPGEVSDEAWDLFVNEARSSLGQTGQIASTGASREWSAKEEHEAFAAATKVGNSTLVRIRSDFSRLFTALTVPTFMVSLMATVVTFALRPVPPGLKIGILTLYFLLLFFFLRKVAGGVLRRQAEIIERLFLNMLELSERKNNGIDQQSNIAIESEADTTIRIQN